MPEIKNVSKLLFIFMISAVPVLQKHSKFERMRGCNCSFIIKGAYHRMDGCYWNCELALKKGLTAGACC